MWNHLTNEKLLIHGQFQVGGKGFSHFFESTHHKCSGESADNDVRLLQGERVCSRKTAEVRWLLFLWCRLVTFWRLGSDVVSSAPSCLLSDLEARDDVKSIVFAVNGGVWTRVMCCEERIRDVFTCRIKPFLQMSKASIRFLFLSFPRLFQRSKVRPKLVWWRRQGSHKGNPTQPAWISYTSSCNQPLSR